MCAVRGEATEEQPIAWGDFPLSMRNGSVPESAYIFYELGGIDAAGGSFELAGAAVSEEAKRLVAALPGLGDWLGPVMRKQNEAYPRANGRLLISAGSWGNGRPFHAHGPALFALVSGVKHWYVRRPNASFEWQRFEIARGALAESVTLPSGWEAELWQCAQSEGELVWVPDLHHHATLNFDHDTVGFTMVIDDLAPLTPLHYAAQSDDAAEVRALIAQGEAVDTPAGGGATPLHYAAGLGNCNALEALVDGAADVDAKSKAGESPLHLAVGGGHERAAALLVKRGASLVAVGQHGSTALQIAERLEMRSMASMLRRAEEKSEL